MILSYERSLNFVLKKVVINKLTTSILILTGFTFFNPMIHSNQSKINESSNSQKDLEKSFYILGAGDILSLNIYAVDKYSGQYKISRNGDLNLPLIGNVYVAGFTIDKLKIRLIELYSEELINPELDVAIFKERPIKVSVVGEVNNPGFHNLTEGYVFPLKSKSSDGRAISFNKNNEINYNPTLIDALQMAGGITNQGDIEKIILIRKLEGQKNESKKAIINLLLTIKDGDQTQNPYLYDGDIIKISKAEKTLSPLALSSSNISASVKNVYIVGEVFKPGLITLARNTSLSQAIMKAGGPKNFTSNTGRIQLLRTNSDGTITKKRFKLNLSQMQSSKKNPLIMDNDIIYVSQNSFAKTVGTLNVITAPFSGIKNVIDVFKLISD